MYLKFARLRSCPPLLQMKGLVALRRRSRDLPFPCKIRYASHTIMIALPFASRMRVRGVEEDALFSQLPQLAHNSIR